MQRICAVLIFLIREYEHCLSEVNLPRNPDDRTASVLATQVSISGRETGLPIRLTAGGGFNVPRAVRGNCVCSPGSRSFWHKVCQMIQL